MCSGLPCLHPDTLLLALVSLTQEADLLQANFKKYASGGGFVSQELADAIVAAGPKKASYANGTA